MDLYLLSAGTTIGIVFFALGIIIGRVTARSGVRASEAEFQGQLNMKDQQLLQAELMYDCLLYTSPSPRD